MLTMNRTQNKEASSLKMVTKSPKRKHKTRKRKRTKIKTDVLPYFVTPRTRTIEI